MVALQDIADLSDSDVVVILANPDDEIKNLVDFDSLDAIELEMEFETKYEAVLPHLEEEYIFSNMSFNGIMKSMLGLLPNE